MHVIAGKAVAAEECLTEDYKTYMKQVVDNCRAMADEFQKLGYKIISGGTENHLFLLDLRGTGKSGMDVQVACDESGITLNKNAVPGDPLPPSQTSGVRIGTAAMTTKGYKEEDFRKVAKIIDLIIKK